MPKAKKPAKKAASKKSNPVAAQLKKAQATVLAQLAQNAQHMQKHLQQLKAKVAKAKAASQQANKRHSELQQKSKVSKTKVASAQLAKAKKAYAVADKQCAKLEQDLKQASLAQLQAANEHKKYAAAFKEMDRFVKAWQAPAAKKPAVKSKAKAKKTGALKKKPVMPSKPKSNITDPFTNKKQQPLIKEIEMNEIKKFEDNSFAQQSTGYDVN